ncbi:MAG: aminotransferase class III-fold pyridoxal phosphate-dependent enzyme [Planctomycetota bacterium]|nr:aminotransferase class III-fold pyridoxal phosphate-dependent enzyme [Planctomycetota bacterium]MDA1106002.1 aminotransferase class III-fold pyridoxal phosphate-dependent enzyme [Planctomycetota bacterium]
MHGTARGTAASTDWTRVASQLAGDPAVVDAIDTIVARVEADSQSITDVRLADPARIKERDELLARVAAVRGRPAFFPYLGTGRGRGALVELVDGSVKWDMISGIGVYMLGHAHPVAIRAALEAGLSDLCMQGNLQTNADALPIAELLVREAARTSAIKHCFITNSGCMANENALKICQQKTGAAPRVIAFRDCFMGRSTTMAQLGDGPAYRQGLVLNQQVDYLPFYDHSMGSRSTERTAAQLAELLHRYPKQHSCIVVEPVQGEGGFKTAPREFFATLFDACRAAGVPVWLDEIQTFGRTEALYAFEWLGLGSLVDVCTVGKMSQVCACLYTEAMAPKPGLMSGTFTASTTAFHVGRATVEYLIASGAFGADGGNAKIHASFRAAVDRLVAKHPEAFPAVRDGQGVEQPGFAGGVGGMCRLTPFGGEKARVDSLVKALFEEGVMTFACGHGPYHIRFMPPVGAFDPADWTSVFACVERAIARVASAA